MRRPLPLSWLLAFLLSLATPLSAQADTKVLIAEGAYTMGEGETMTFAEAMALQKAKQMALEQAGTYVESYTKVQNYQLTAEEIQTVAGGVLQVEVLEKTRTLVGDGLKFFVKIKATVTTDKVAELAQRIKGKNVAEEYKKLQEEYARLNKEIETWKQIVAQSQPGPRREEAFEQIHSAERAFASARKSEEALVQRLVSGEALANEGLHQQAIIDELFLTILKEGHQLTIERPTVFPNPKKPDLSDVTISMTVAAAQGVIPAFKVAASKLGGTIQDRQPLTIAKSDVLGAGSDTDFIDVTLIRVASDIEPSHYLQERINNLALAIELADSKGLLGQCYLRYYAEEILPIPEFQAASRSALIDERIRLTEETDLSMKQFDLVAEENIKTYRDLIKEIDSTLHGLNKAVRKSLSKDEQVTVGKRTRLYGLAMSSGIFLRIAPVQSRLSPSGIYGAGRPSNRHSKRQKDSGFVAIFHNPATLKIQFAIPENQAKRIKLINAKVVEMTAEKWETLNDNDRCKVVR